MGGEECYDVFFGEGEFDMFAGGGLILLAI